MQDPKVQTSLSNLRLGLDVDKFLNSLNKKVIGVETGISRLDKSLSGLAGFVGIIGEPKACKSTLAMQIAAYNAVELGNPVYFVDQENGKTRLSKRLICHLNGVSWTDLHNNKDAGELYQQLSEHPLYCHFGRVDMDLIQQGVSEMFKMHPSKRGLLIIDSLQSVAKTLTDLRMSIDQWLLDLDELKLKYDGQLTIIVICEKRRGTYGTASVDSAKESGRIEYKVEQQLDLRNEDGMIIIECTLNRDGPKGIKVPLVKNLQFFGRDESFTFKLIEDQVMLGKI